MVLAEIDFEAYSEAGYVYDPVARKWKAPEGAPSGKKGLEIVGAAVYAEHPSTEVISLGYDLNDGKGPRQWIPGRPLPVDLFDYIRAGGLVEAHNSLFEFFIWHYVCYARMGWPALPLDQLRCSQSKCNAWGLPGKLEEAAKALKAPHQKDAAGKALIRKLSVPRNPTKNNPDLRYTRLTAPEDFEHFDRYNIQDIIAERSISSMIPDLSPEELELWLIDQRINVRGIPIDKKGLSDCREIVRQAKERYTAELAQLTGIPDVTVDKLAQIRKWMDARGYPMPSLDAEHVAAALKRTDLPPDIYRVLQIREVLGSASVKKTAAMERTANSDNRLRGLFVMNGARATGRWSGKGVQPHNSPKAGPGVYECQDCGGVYWRGLTFCPQCGSRHREKAEWSYKAAEAALQAIASRDLDTVEALWGDPMLAVAGCIRALFCTPPDKEFICSDYSAIEAVVLACLAREEWRVEVFRGHGLIYEMSASKITGVPFEEFVQYKKENGTHHPHRAKYGKIPELAYGYQGAMGAAVQFGADKFMSEDEILKSVKDWRRESPNIVKFWYGLQDAAVAAILSPGQCYQYNGITYGVKDNVLYCKLLSGRTLAYHKPRVELETNPWGKQSYKIYFWGYNSDSTKGPMGWTERDTYGGKLCENVVQATANDILRYAIVNLEKAGYPVVLHVHDEPVAEVPKGWGSIEEFENIMMTLPPWCANWPIKASGGWRGRRYRKD